MTTSAVVLVILAGLAGAGLAWWRSRRRAAPPLQQPEGRYTVRYANERGAWLVHRGGDVREAKRVFAEADQVPRGEMLEFWDGPHRRGLKLIT